MIATKNRSTSGFLTGSLCIISQLHGFTALELFTVMLYKCHHFTPEPRLQIENMETWWLFKAKLIVGRFEVEKEKGDSCQRKSFWLELACTI